MQDETRLFQELQSLAVTFQCDVETLISRITDIDTTPRLKQNSAQYYELLKSVTALVSEIDRVELTFEKWFDSIDQIVPFDRGVAITFAHDLAFTQYVADKLFVNSGISYFQQKISELPYLQQIVDQHEVVLLDQNSIQRINLHYNMTGIESGIILPVINNGIALGCIVLFTTAKDQIYTLQDNNDLQPFLHLLSGIMQNITLMSTISSNADELAQLYHATSVLFKADTVEDFAEQITEVVTRTFNYADCGLMLVDSDTGQIDRIKRAGSGVVSPITVLRVDGQGLVPKAVREGRMVYAPDVRIVTDYIVGDEQSLCELVVPLKARQQIIGVLDFQSRTTNAFNDRDQRIIIAFAERVAPALENVLLFEQLRQYMTELEQRVKERTHELESTKEQLETILRNSPDAIVMLDSMGQIKQANLSWLSMVGQSMHNVVGRKLADFLPETHQESFNTVFYATLKDELENDIAVELPHQIRGKKIEVEISLAPIIDEREHGIVCNIRDISHYRESERMLRETLAKTEELSQLKMNFVTMASHEFRTPLTTILSSSDIVAQYHERLSVGKVKNHMDKIRREVDHLDGLINDILVIGRTNDEGFTPKYDSIDFVKLIREVVGRIRKADHNQHPIQVQLANNINDVLMDSKLIAHIIDNLLMNACKYSEVGKPVHLQLILDHDLNIIVKDSGIGIPEKDREFLFDSFYRGSNVGNIRGTGIGLAIVNEAIVALNGRAQVKSIVGQGSTFHIILPLPTQENIALE